ncbi:MAG: hypothetical protein R2791_06640 [Saprospiraceae bacterium]
MVVIFGMWKYRRKGMSAGPNAGAAHRFGLNFIGMIQLLLRCATRIKTRKMQLIFPGIAGFEK